MAILIGGCFLSHLITDASDAHAHKNNHTERALLSLYLAEVRERTSNGISQHGTCSCFVAISFHKLTCPTCNADLEPLKNESFSGFLVHLLVFQANWHHPFPSPWWECFQFPKAMQYMNSATYLFLFL